MPIVTGTVITGCKISKLADGTDIPIGVITIASVTAAGKYTTQAGTGSISEYTVGDIVTIQSCSVGGGDKNGEFKISVIDNTNDITLVNKDGTSLSSLDTDTTGCKLSKHVKGTLVSLHGEKQSDGTMLYIKASDLSTGSAITVESLSSLTSGTLLDMSTTTTDGHAEGLVRLTANAMTTGVGMKINTNGLTTGKGLHITSGTGTTLDTTEHLLYIEGVNQDDGNIVEISATDMATGNLLKLTGGDSLSSGKMFDLFTGSTGLSNGAFEITANTLQTGHILRISGNAMTDANMIDLLSSSTGMTDTNGKIIHMSISGAKHGTMIDVKAPELDDGTMLLLTAAKLKTGKILDLTDNTLLTSGKLLHMKTTSAVTANPILIELQKIDNEIGMQMDYEDLTTGTGLLIDSLDGNSLATTIEVADTVVTIDSVTAAGAYTVTGTITGNYAQGDIVTVAGCTHLVNFANLTK